MCSGVACTGRSAVQCGCYRVVEHDAQRSVCDVDMDVACGLAHSMMCAGGSCDGLRCVVQ